MSARFISPELATLAKEPFTDKDWIFEEKFDGIRCIAVKSKGKVSLYSRNKKSLNKDFPNIVKALEKKSKDFVIDGELVVFDGKVTSFSKLQSRKQEKVKVFFYLFDLLIYNDNDLRKEPLLKRKAELKNHLGFGSPIRYTPHKKANGTTYFKAAEKKGLEGIIGKRADSIYKSKRTRDWLKFKCTARQELVIGGYTDPKRSRKGFGALLVGYYTSKGLHYAGKVGTGYDTKQLQSLSLRLGKIERQTSPFASKLKGADIHYVTPTLVCEVGFTEWTKDGKLRHPRFLGLRKDKKAKNVKRQSC